MTTAISSVTITLQQAAVIYSALEKAITVVEDLQKRKSASMVIFKGALAIELASYKAERDRLGATFPVLVEALAAKPNANEAA